MTIGGAKMYELKYNKIPTEWINGLPIGNGRLAAMYWGDDKKDILSLNHEYLWRGKNRTRTADKVADKLPLLRELLKRRDYFRATVYANLFFGGYGGDSGMEEGRIDKYQPAGDIVLAFSDASENNTSSLDIERGLLTSKRNEKVSGNFFCDSNDGLVLARWQSEETFSGKISFVRVEDREAECTVKYDADTISFNCSFAGGISYSVVVKIKTDGITKVCADGICIKDAKETILSAPTTLQQEKNTKDLLIVDTSSINGIEDDEILNINIEGIIPIERNNFICKYNSFRQR